MDLISALLAALKHNVHDWFVNLLPTLPQRIVGALLARTLYRIFVQWWLDPLCNAVGSRCAALYRRLRSRDLNLTPRTGSLTLTGYPPGLSHGTVITPPTAGNPPRAPLPQFANNSQWMQWDAYRQQHDLAARFAMASTMKGFPPALLSPPTGPTGFELH